MKYKSKLLKKSKWAATIATLLLYIALPGKIMAQQADSMVVLQQFVKVCNSYKKTPLHVSVTVHNTADIITNPQEDTATFGMEFFIKDNGAYLKMGDDEQVINDSLQLYIENKTRRMVLYPNTGHIADQMVRFAGMLAQDSNLQKFSSKYKAVQLDDSLHQPGMAVIKVTSREIVPGTDLPKETIEARYNVATGQPVTLVQQHRKIIPLDSTVYNSLLQNPVYAGRLVHPLKRLFFLIKQVVSAYTFKKFAFNNDMRLPLLVNSCITKKPDGHYYPVNGYGAFTLSENL